MPDINHFDEDVMDSLDRNARIISIAGPILMGLFIIFMLGWAFLIIRHG